MDFESNGAWWNFNGALAQASAQDPRPAILNSES
jgi:hypothetical protein